jgi:hypothetical protein
MKDKALKLALEALTYKKWFRIGMVEQNDPKVEAAITAIKEALAQPEQERNFCERCGKRTVDLTTIHTCTPPRENT